MSGTPGSIPRLDLNERGQHLLLAVATATALATGSLIGSSVREGRWMDHAAANRLHLLAGFVALLVLCYHIVSLAVRGYVESRGLRSLPLRWGRADREAIFAEFQYLAGSRPGRPEAGEYRASQKAFYWWTLLAIAVTTLSGLGIGSWERLGALGILSRLETLAAVHRGFSLLLLGTILWHLYGALVWEGRWDPVWSWVTGWLPSEQAARRVPGAYRRFLREEAERAEAAAGDADAQLDDRRRREKDEVQEELERGNRLALEEKYVEALYHYRRALERYPGYSQARYNMARVLARMGEKEMAVETYRQFLESDPFHPLAHKAQDAIRELSREEAP